MGGRWRRRNQENSYGNGGGAVGGGGGGGGGGAMDLVAIFWRNSLWIAGVILLFTPPLYPLLVYFSPLLMSTALCVAALLSIGPQIDRLKAHRESSVVVDDDAFVASAPHRHHDVAETWIRGSDVVMADSVRSSAAASSASFAARRYEHFVDWSGESRVQRVCSFGDGVVERVILGRTHHSRGLRSSYESEETEDRWTVWVKEYEARPEWNEATAPPSQDGGFAAAVKREQEMRLEKESLKLEKDKFRERFKVAAIKANLHRHSTQEEGKEAQTKVAGKRHVLDAEALLAIERFLFTDTDASFTMQAPRSSAPNVPDPSPPKTDVPAQVSHQLNTGELAGLGSLNGRCGRGGDNAGVSRVQVPSGASSETDSRNGITSTGALSGVLATEHASNVENEVTTSGQEKKQLKISGDLSPRVSSPASRGKQLSPRMLHILKTAGLGCSRGVSSEASKSSDGVGKKSSVTEHHAESSEDYSDDQESDDDDDDDDDDDSSYNSEIREHVLENGSQSSEPKPVAQDLIPSSISYKASSNSAIGDVQRVYQHGTQGDTPDPTGESSSSQAFHHSASKTDCNTLENPNCSGQEKDKGSIELERIKITHIQSRRHLKSARSFVSQEEHCNLQTSSSLRTASISSLDQRRSTTSTLKPLVWKSRSSDSPEED